MSTIWTPSGEQPIRREQPETGGAEQAPPGTQGAQPPGGRQAQRPVTEEEAQAQLEEMTRELARTPASVVVANHAMGLFELAALHLSQHPPNLSEAQLAIDAMGMLVEGLAGRLGENETTLNDALSQLRLAFVQIRAAGVDLGERHPPQS